MLGQWGPTYIRRTMQTQSEHSLMVRWPKVDEESSVLLSLGKLDGDGYSKTNDFEIQHKKTFMCEHTHRLWVVVA